MNNVERILWEARDKILEPKNWGRYSYRAPVGEGYQYCSVGALMWSGQGIDLENATKILWEIVAATEEDRFTYIQDWNDEWIRTHEEVIAAFDKAIKIAAERFSDVG